MQQRGGGEEVFGFCQVLVPIGATGTLPDAREGASYRNEVLTEVAGHSSESPGHFRAPTRDCRHGPLRVVLTKAVSSNRTQVGKSWSHTTT